MAPMSVETVTVRIELTNGGGVDVERLDGSVHLWRDDWLVVVFVLKGSV